MPVVVVVGAWFFFSWVLSFDLKNRAHAGSVSPVDA